MDVDDYEAKLRKRSKVGEAVGPMAYVLFVLALAGLFEGLSWLFWSRLFGS